MGISAIGPSRVNLQGLIFEEFFHDYTIAWFATLGFGATAKQLIAGFDADYDEGLGIVRLRAAAAGDTAELNPSAGDPIAISATTKAITFEALVRTNITPADLDVTIGLKDTQNTTFALLQMGDGVGGLNWRLRVESSTGAGAVTVDSGVAVTLNAYHRVRIEIIPGVSATAFLNGTQIAQVLSNTQVPQAGDGMTISMGATFLQNAGGNAYLDLVDLRVG